MLAEKPWNLTRMECKSPITKTSDNANEPGILPEWNVNMYLRYTVLRMGKPGILPEWNVNTVLLPLPWQAHALESYQNGM